MDHSPFLLRIENGKLWAYFITGPADSSSGMKPPLTGRSAAPTIYGREWIIIVQNQIDPG
jgi:hypothetical protein